MKSTKRRTALISVLCIGIVFALISLVGFLFIPLTPTFLIVWGFTGLSYGLCATLIARSTLIDVDGGFLKLPRCMTALAYATVQSAAGIALVLIPVPWVTALVICLAILSIEAIALLALGASGSYIATRDQEVKRKRAFVTELIVDLRIAQEAVGCPTASQALSALMSDLRYSDPMGCEATQDLENRIRSLVADIRTAAEHGDIPRVESLCKQAQSLTKERAMRCRNSK